MENIVNELMRMLGLHVYGCKKIKASVLLDTNKGSVLMKSTALPVDHLSKTAALCETLYEHQVYQASRFLYHNKKPYISLHGSNYIAALCGMGDLSDLADTASATAVATALGQFHLQTSQLPPPVIKKLESLFENSKYLAPVYLEKRIAAFKRHKKYLGQQSRQGDVDFLFAANYPKFLVSAQKSVPVLSDSAVNATRALCIGEIKEAHVLIDDAGNAIFSNMENCILSHPVTDAGRLIHRFIKRGGNPAEASLIIKAYATAAELSPFEIQLLKAVLSFPYRYLELMEAYQNSRRVCQNGHTYLRLKNEAACQNKIYALLEDLDL